MYVFLNGEIVPEGVASIPVSDRGFLLGDGVFETMRVYDGYPFRLNDHLERLHLGAERLKIGVPVEREALRRVVYELIDKNGIKTGVIRITLTRGTGGRGILPPENQKPTLVVTASPWDSPSEELYKKGVRVVVSDDPLSFRTNQDVYLKPVSFLYYILKRLDTGGGDVYDVILKDHNGYITEGTVSNIFFVLDDTLFTPTPELGILMGITRGVVIELARRMGLSVVEGCYTLGDIEGAHEVFLTNSLIEIMPVSVLDGRQFTIGNITNKLITAYREMVDEEKQRGDSTED